MKKTKTFPFLNVPIFCIETATSFLSPSDASGHLKSGRVFYLSEGIH